MPPATVLVVDAEEVFRLGLCAHLERLGHRTIGVADGQEALGYLATVRPDLALMDIDAWHPDGLEVIRAMREQHPRMPLVLVTADDRMESSLRASRLGVRAFLTKPLDLLELSRTVGTLLQEERGRRENAPPPVEAGRFDGLVGRSAPLLDARLTLTRAAAADTPVLLIEGAAGTGKSLAAALYHAHGPQRDGPYVEIDCGSIRDDALEDALFGAWSNEIPRRGAFERAADGTLVLDDITALSHRAQGLLAHALERRSYRRVGGFVQVPIHARVIALSRRPLRAETRAERFRENLFFRLALVTVHMPPLSARTDDLVLLVPHLVAQAARDLARPVRGVSPEALSVLAGHPWTGNVRELRMVLESAVVLRGSGIIEPIDLPASVRGDELEGAEVFPFELPARGVTLASVERGLIFQALSRARGNEVTTASLLGMTVPALRERMAAAGIRPTTGAQRQGADVLAFDRDAAEDRPFIPLRPRRLG